MSKSFLSRASRCGSLIPFLLASLSSACAVPAGDNVDLAGSIASNSSAIGGIYLPVPISNVAARRVSALQPGWAQLTLGWTGTLKSPLFVFYPTCEPGTDPDTIAFETTFRSAEQQVLVDVRPRMSIIVEKNYPRPCRIRSLDVSIRESGSAYAWTKFNMTVDVLVDLPTPYQRPSHFAGIAVDRDFVSLDVPASERRYAAYPPRLFAIVTPYDEYAILEVESLPNRGTVGVRALSTYHFDAPVIDFNGGAELYPWWGIDVARLGVTRDAEAIEISNPGKNAFPTTRTTIFGIPLPWSPAELSAWWNPIFPAAPIFADGSSGVLDNREVPRVLHGFRRIDVYYEPNNNGLRAANGAKIAALDLGPLQRDNMPVVEAPVAATPGQLSPLVSESPPEKYMWRWLETPKMPAGAAPSCTINATTKKSSTRVAPCSGFSNASFRCPRPADPLRIEDLPPAPGSGGEASVLASMSPQPWSAVNTAGTCGTHSLLQVDQALLNKLARDLGPRPTMRVDGRQVPIPDAKIGLSTAAQTWNLYRWVGTRAEDPATEGPTQEEHKTNWPKNGEEFAFPQFIDGYWPAREIWWNEWISWRDPAIALSSKAVAELDKCKRIGWWASGFCLGHGDPPPGVYRNYTNMVMTNVRADNPLRDGIWSLGNTHFGLKRTPIDLGSTTADRDVAIQKMIDVLRSGLPVQLDWNSGLSGRVQDPDGRDVSLFDEGNYFLPPEVAGCDRQTLDDAFVPTGGHATAIVGYSLAGSMEKPDLVNSYVVIENNAGRGYGRQGRIAMNLAYLRWIAKGIWVYRVDRTCSSAACAGH
jgi:hypothetical protein